MVMSPDPLEKALKAARQRQKSCGVRESRVIYFSPQGQPLTHARVAALMAQPGLILLCGRYEGVDERLIERQVDEELSIGDYVVSGGELPAMVLMDAMIRQVPGVLNDADSAANDSFVNGLLDHPHYTRPATFRGMAVPEVLLSGNHAEIERWRRQAAADKTRRNRPDLLER
jgi:tRNA (guanine37-N1)-methyltransferase